MYHSCLQPVAIEVMLVVKHGLAFPGLCSANQPLPCDAQGLKQVVVSLLFTSFKMRSLFNEPRGFLWRPLGAFQVESLNIYF